jgi:hypothetical protein
MSVANPSNLQTLPSSAVPVYVVNQSYLNITTSTQTQVKTGPGVLGALVVNTGGTTSAVKFYDGASSVVTISLASPGIVSWTAHGLAAGTGVTFETTGALPTGMTAGTQYFVSITTLTANSFTLADTKAHALAGTNGINTSVSQSGVQTAYVTNNLIATVPTTAQSSLNYNVAFTLGLIAFTTDGGGAANISVLYS